MKKILITTKTLCWVMLLTVFQIGDLQAQTATADISVLKMAGASNHTTHFDTNIGLKSMLIDPGVNAGEGTIEFWTKFQNDSQSLVLTTDALSDAGLSLTMFRNTVAIKTKDINDGQSISTPNRLDTYWQHFAYTFYKIDDQNHYNIDVYVDGVRVKTFANIEIAIDYDLYFTKGNASDEILLTELKAWNIKRTVVEIATKRYTSFNSYDEATIEYERTNSGLVANYSRDAEVMSGNLYLPELINTHWKNTIQKDGYPRYGTIVSKVKSTGIDKDLAFINANMGNPINELNQIIVQASKGQYDNKVEISWFHIETLTNYTVYEGTRRVGDISGESGATGKQLVVVDTDALPGTIYNYRVEGTGSETKFGSSEGFIFPNGTLSGTIKTESNVYVEDVNVAIGLDNGKGINGAALSFAANSEKVTFLDRKLLVDTNDITIEFWYRNDATTIAGSNTVFKLGTTEIVMGYDSTGANSTTTLNYNNNNVRKEFATGTSDNEWHHYAYALGSSGIEMFKDGVSVGTHAVGFNWSSTSIDYNYYINHKAEYAYSLDEFRVWKGKKDIDAIKKYAPYVVDAEQTDLLIAYSMDLQGKKEMYNHASMSKGSYVGKSANDLVYTPQSSNLLYVAFTNTQKGFYKFSSMYSTSEIGRDTYTAVASKPNHIFKPDSITKLEIRQSSLASDYSKVADFTDISSMSVSGSIYYIVDGYPNGIPVPKGKQIAKNGRPVLGDDPGLTSNDLGKYNLSFPLGKYEFEVFNPVLDNNLNLSSLNFSPKEEDDLITSGGYAVSKKSLNYQNEGITLSGFVKPYISVVYPGYVAVNQTLVKYGNVEVILKNNNIVQLLYNEALQKEIPITNPNAFTYFAVAIEQDGNYGFMVDDNYKSGGISTVSFTGSKLYLGATIDEAGAITADNLSNLARIQFRNKAYDESQLVAVKEGSIITDDSDVLLLSFQFDQEKGNRALSKTIEGKDNYLLLHDDAKIDASQVFTHTQKYKYEYVAANASYNPEGGMYDLNVIAPLGDVNFEMKDRYGFVGNLVIPCDNSIGAWRGTITRTDNQTIPFAKDIEPSDFDSENKIFLIDGLIPGKYQVLLTNEADTTITLTSPIIDLTKGWATHDFEYRAPLTIDVNAYVVKEEKATFPLSELVKEDFELLEKVCGNDFYVMSEGNPVLLEVIAYEQYAEGVCMVPNAEVAFLGDLLKLSSDNSAVKSKTDENGHAVLTSFATSPDFTSDHHTKTFSIGVTHDNRNSTKTIKGLIEGAVMSASDFTIKDPIVNHVLHDPAGDGSSATLKKGTTATTTGRWNASLGYTGTMSNQVGVKFEQDVVLTVFGVGTSIQALKTDVTAGVDTKFTILGTYSGSTSTQVSNTKDITTSTSGDLVGRDADLFIGTGYLITVGSGKTLKYDVANCKVEYDESSPVMSNQIENSFVHSYSDIKKNMIPNLVKSIINEPDVKEQETYRNSALKWIDNLVRNDMALNLYKKTDYGFINSENALPFLKDKYASLPEGQDTSRYKWSDYPTFKGLDANPSFDGGIGSVSQSITTTNTLSNGADFKSTFDIGYKTVVKAAIAGVSAELSYSNTINSSLGGGFEITNSDNEVVEYKFADDDTGDRFAQEIRRDPDFAIPIFKTTAGKSSCPAERGTQIRQGVAISADSYIKDGITGDVLEYNVSLLNTQIAGNADSAKTYKLALLADSNPDGAVIRVNGSLLGPSGVDFIFGLDSDSSTGVEKSKDVIIKIAAPSSETGSEIAYEDLKFVFKVPCEGANDLGYAQTASVYREAGIQSIDTLSLSAKFRGPCIKNLVMESPQENWVVNQSNHEPDSGEDLLDFAFTIPGVTFDDDVITLPESLTAVEVEYALEDNNTATFLQEITADDLKTMYRDNAFRVPVDVSGFVDGVYGFRLVPVCGLGQENWRRNVPTEYAYGTISRKAPVLLETNPAEGGLLTEGSITATYNSALDPRTLNSLNIALRGTLGGLPRELVSVDFDNVNDEITIPSGPFLDIPATDGYTIEFWMNPTNYPATATNLFSKGSNYSLSMQADGRLNYLNGQIGGATVASVPLQEWTHVAMVYNGETSLSFYFNGVLVHSDTGFNNAGTQVVPSVDDLIIGGTANNSEGFVGQLDELRIWSTVRSHSDIVTYKNKQLLGNEVNLRAYYVFDNNALENDGYQEAVRDYTGNTSGSSHTGISWVEGNQAAPLSVAYMVQDIPITVATNIDSNMIIITPLNFPQYYLEGAKLTAVFNGNTIKGIYGNPVDAHSWSFTINKNNVSWDKANITASQTVGTSIVIDALLTNEGGSNATFELQSLPEWLKCTNATVGSSEDLPAGFENTLQFATSAYLSKGTYAANIGVITYNQDGAKTGYEYFAFELDVDCDTPDYTFNTANFARKKEFTGQLTVADQLSVDANDMVVAYFNDEIRGKGHVTRVNNEHRVLLDVFYNTGESGNLTFRVWDDSDCKEYIGLTEIYAIGNGSSEGTSATPVPFITGDVVVKRIPLLAGYQEVSFNSVTNGSATDLQISNIRGMTAGDEIEELESGNIVTFDTNGIASGAFSTLDYTKGYQVYSTSNKLIQLQGIEAPIKTDISIVGGSDNYVGYIPDVMLNGSYALRSLSNRFTTGDRISGRSGFSEFTDEGWTGTLTHLIPNKSYNIIMKNSGTLNYSGIVGNTDAVRAGVDSAIGFEDISKSIDPVALDMEYLENAAQKGIVVDSYKYPYAMSVTAKIVSDFIDTDKEYVLAAFYDGQTRGIAKPVSIDGDLVYFMTVYGNHKEDISFKLFTDTGSYTIDNSLIFSKNSFVGELAQVQSLYISEKSWMSKSVLSIDKNPVSDVATITINPKQTDMYEISMYDVIGRKVAVLFDGKIKVNERTTIKLDRRSNPQLVNLPSGIYICNMSGSTTNKTLKVVLK